MDRFVSKAQNGFVLSRQIVDNTLLCKLVQAYLDEREEPGLLLFLDLEKEFDRVSHEYLHEAMRSAGVLDGFRKWVRVLYNPQGPIRLR